MTTYETITVGSEGSTLSRIVWRRFRRRMPDLVTRTLDINPGLAARGPVLPVGTAFRLPVEPPPTVFTRPVINVWD